MTQHECLLVQLGEEAAEVTQAVSKYLRFGQTHTHPTVHGTTEECVMAEVVDVLALVELCQSHGLLPRIAPSEERALIDAKKHRVAQYLLISQQEGTVQ